MPRKTDLAEAEVFTAIQVLLASGIYPTAARLREALEHRGSPVVLQRFLADWYAQHGPELAKKAAAAPAKTAAGGLQAELKRLTAQAVQEVEVAQAARIATLDDRAAALDGRDAGLVQREAQQDAREAAHAELLVDLRQQLATANTQLDAAHARAVEEAGAGRAQIEALQNALAARDAELGRLRPVAEKLPAVQANVERAQADAAREQARVLKLVGERDRLQRLASERAADLAKAKGALERSDATGAIQEAALAALRQQLQDALSSLANSEGRGETLARDLELAETGRRADAERIEDLRRAGADKDQQLAVLSTRLDAARVELSRLDGVVAGLAELQDAVLGLGAQLRKSTVRREKPGSED